MNHRVKVAKGIFGFVFENRDKLDTNVYRTLTHDLGIIIRGDKLAMPYTIGKETVMEEFLADGKDICSVPGFGSAFLAAN
jgi:hypothetical protein